MIEALPGAAGPSDQPRVPSEMLDVASTTVLASILASMQTGLPPYLGAQVVVAPEASVGIDPLASRVAFTAIRVAIDLGVGTSELPWRQKLGAR